MRIAVICALAFTGCLGHVEVFAQATHVPPANPPRTQQDIMQERRMACRDLKGAEFRECLNNYVGTQDKSQAADSERDRDKADKPAAPAPRPDDTVPDKTEPKK